MNGGSAAVGDQLVVDVSEMERLSRELSAAADELRDHAERFARAMGVDADAYGHLPLSHEAADQHAELSRDMLRQLARMEAAHRSHAEALRVAARDLAAVEAENAARARRDG